jgi:hypothetical protein
MRLARLLPRSNSDGPPTPNHPLSREASGARTSGKAFRCPSICFMSPPRLPPLVMQGNNPSFSGLGNLASIRGSGFLKTPKSPAPDCVKTQFFEDGSQQIDRLQSEESQKTGFSHALAPEVSSMILIFTGFSFDVNIFTMGPDPGRCYGSLLLKLIRPPVLCMTI